MSDHLDRLARTALETVRKGHYARPPRARTRAEGGFLSLIRARPGGVLVAEVKPASPSGGPLLRGRSPRQVVDLYAAAGVHGLSVLTEPVHFGGALETLSHAAQCGRPVLCKDFVLDPSQLDAARAGGASAVLLILALFERGYGTLPLPRMIGAAHARDLEVLLEVYDAAEYERALASEAEMIGINNRDLKTLSVDLSATERILERHPKDRPVWGLSGVHTGQDVQRLRRAGVDAVLVGTALMRAADPLALARRLLRALSPEGRGRVEAG